MRDRCPLPSCAGKRTSVAALPECAGCGCVSVVGTEAPAADDSSLCSRSKKSSERTSPGSIRLGVRSASSDWGLSGTVSWDGRRGRLWLSLLWWLRPVVAAFAVAGRAGSSSLGR